MLLQPKRRKLISTSLSAATGMHLANQMAMPREYFTLAWWHQRTHTNSSALTMWATHTGQYQVFNSNSGNGMRARCYNNQSSGDPTTLIQIGDWHQFTITFGVDHYGTMDLRILQDDVEIKNRTGGSAGSEITSLGTHWLMGDDSVTADTDEGYRGQIFDFVVLDGIWGPQQLHWSPGRWRDLPEDAKRSLIYRIDGQDVDPGRDSSGNGHHFIVENGGVTLSDRDLPPGANAPQFSPVGYLPAVGAAGPLNNNRISSMHFQRHYEPIAMGV